MKLKHLLIFIFLVMSTAPLFIGLKYLNNHVGAYSQKQFSEHLSAMSQIAKQRILTAVYRIEDSTALIASRTQMRISLSEWNRTKSQTHLTKMNKIIQDAKYGLHHIRDINLYDKHGVFVASSSPTPKQSTLDLNTSIKSTVQLKVEHEEILASVQQPLTLNHDTVGYIQINYFTDFINDLVRDRTGLGETGEWLFAVRNENGDALFAVPLKYDHRAAFIKTIPKERTDIPITQALLGNEIIMKNAPDYRGVPVLAATRYLRQLDWGLVAKIDESEVNQLVNNNDVIIYIAQFIIVIFSLIIGVIVAFFIAHPVELLSKHTARVEAGNLEEPPALSGWQEVKDLTFHFSQMIRTIRDFNKDLQIKIDQKTQELQRANEELEELATHDPLTGLLNRRKFETCLQKEFDRSKRYHHCLAAVMMDVDHFKSINDKYGHAMGDEVLQKFANHLDSYCRDSDIVARIGGEEFCILLVECESDNAITILDRIRQGLSEIEFQTNPEPFFATCSFGVTFIDDACTTPEELLKQADTALYAAKHNGRNCIVQYSQLKN